MAIVKSPQERQADALGQIQGDWFLLEDGPGEVVRCVVKQIAPPEQITLAGVKPGFVYRASGDGAIYYGIAGDDGTAVLKRSDTI